MSYPSIIYLSAFLPIAVYAFFKRITVRKGRLDKDNFNSIDVVFTEPFWLLREKWFNKAWEKDKKNPSSGGSGGTIKTKMRESDKVGPEDCLSTT